MVHYDSITKEPLYIDLYDTNSKKNYGYPADQNEWCMWSKADKYKNINWKINIDRDDTLLILGTKCSSITIDGGNNLKNKLYFRNIDKVNIDSMIISSTNIYSYISESGCVPMRIIMYNYITKYIIVWTAIEVEMMFEKPF